MESLRAKQLKYSITETIEKRGQGLAKLEAVMAFNKYEVACHATVGANTLAIRLTDEQYIGTNRSLTPIWNCWKALTPRLMTATELESCFLLIHSGPATFMNSFSYQRTTL